MTTTTHTLPGYQTKTLLTYRGLFTVSVFGIERNDDQTVKYYWVVDNNKRRFKAFPSELKLL